MDPFRHSEVGEPDHEIAIIGTGFAGLGMAIELERSGSGSDYIVFERAASVGGTWRDNHYPGCACDVPAPLYSFSFAANPEWSQLYAPYDEIRDYMEDCTDRYGVRPRIRFNQGVRRSRWLEDGQRWELELDDGSTTTARFVVAGIGGLNRPSFPEIEGLQSFPGPVLHSAAWDDDLDLTGKRVAVIGTGASAIQLIPRLAEGAAHVDVYQRTPPWVMPQPNFRIPAWMKALFRRAPLTQRALRALIWAIQESVALPLTKAPELLRVGELQARAHIRKGIADPELRERVTPDYRLGCKRILLSNDYYPALGRDDVDVVTTAIERVGEGGIVGADGVERGADVIVCATGFDIRDALTQVEVEGRGGRTLAGDWAERIEAHRGTMVAGYPNSFLLSGPNTGTGNMSQVFMIEAQIAFVRALMEEMERRGAAEVDVRPEAQQAFNRGLLQRMEGTVWLTGGCESWYLTEEGHTGVLWPGFSTSFRRSLAAPDPTEFEFAPARKPVPDPDPEPAAA